MRIKRTRSATALAACVCLFGMIAAAPLDELDDAIAEADRLDPGWRLEQLLEKRKKERPPDDQNSAIQAQRALAQFPNDWLAAPPEEANRPLAAGEVPRGVRLQSHVAKLGADERLPENLAKGLRAELDALAPAVAQARKLAAMPEGQTDFQPAINPLDTLLPYTQQARQLTRLLQLDAYRRLHDGDADGAIESVRAILNLSRSLGDEPTLISQLVRAAIDGVAVQTLTRVLALGEPSDAALAAAQEAFAREAAEPRFLYGLRGERAISFDVIGKLASGVMRASDLTGQEDDALEKLIRPGALGEGYYRRNRAVTLKMMTELVEIAKKPRPSWAAAIGEWEAHLENDVLAPGKKQDNVFAALLLPAVSYSGKADLRITCTLECAVAAAACKRFQLAEKRWPRSLDELVPRFLKQVPVDPYTGQPLKLAATAEGLVVYGASEDRQDDGGKLHPQNRTDEPGFDVGVRIPTATKRQESRR